MLSTQFLLKLPGHAWLRFLPLMVFQMVTQSSCFHSVSRGGGIKEGEDRRQTNCVGQSREKGRELTVDRSLNFFVSEMEKTTQAATEQMTSGRDLSEQIKEVTKENHVRAENTEMMLNFQRGQVTLTQYKLLLCSLYEIYRALEEELDKNSDHPGVAPIYFPSELARLESIEKDLEHFYGQEWRERIVVPAATERYCHRLRQIGKENPELLVAHTYTRYLGDLSGGQVLGRITQKSFGLKNSVGLSFFAFPNVSSPNLFKQLYRSRMNSLELTEEEKTGVLKEAVTAFEFNIQVFQDLQKMLSVTGEKLQNEATPSKFMKTLQFSQTAISTSPVLRMLLGLFVALATVTLFVKF